MAPGREALSDCFRWHETCRNWPGPKTYAQSICHVMQNDKQQRQLAMTALAKEKGWPPPTEQK
jgi:hypothetical protein